MTALVFKQLLLGAAAFLATTALFSSVTTDPVPAPNRYIGAKACKNCHSSQGKGAQFEKWEASKHSKAFARLRGVGPGTFRKEQRKLRVS